MSLAVEGDLRRVTATDAAAVCDAVAEWQALQGRRRGIDFVHAADEFHLLHGEFPPASDAPYQYENGIGISAARCSPRPRSWARRPARAGRRARGLLCGTLALPVVERPPALLSGGAPRAPRSSVTNRLFGPHVTVTGLLGGDEVLGALRAAPLAEGEWLLAPRVFLPRSRAHAGRRRRGRAGGRLRRPLVLADVLADGFARLCG